MIFWVYILHPFPLSFSLTSIFLNLFLLVSLPALSTLNSISHPPKIYVQTDRDPTAINIARRTCVHLCVREIQSTCCFLQSSARIHLVTLWSNHKWKVGEGERDHRRRKTQKESRKTLKIIIKKLPLLSFREKFWLWATSGARLNVKCCLWPISSLSTALIVSIT